MKGVKSYLKYVVVLVFAVVAGVVIWQYNQAESASTTVSEQKPPVPGLDEIPDGPEGELIKQGRKYMMETHTALDGYVGNKLSCASCHANAGAGPALDLVGVDKTYPMYNSRAGKDVDLRDRVNGCFQRSMNGTPLDKNGPEMDAMIAWLEFIGQNAPEDTTRAWAKIKIEGELPKADVANGERLYNLACASCHAVDGSGNDDGSKFGLAVWGDDSYNVGAGMNRLRTAAGFIQKYMPKAHMGNIQTGTLTTQEAIDIATYINSHARPDFPNKIYDWPNGDAPDDAAYETLSMQKKKAEEAAKKEQDSK